LNAVEELGLKNVKVHPIAIGAKSGKQKMHVTTLGDWGVSSLSQFNRENLSTNSYWKTRKDLCFETDYYVEVRRLDEVINFLGISKIEFIKIDTQGTNLDVLESLGNKSEIVSSGMIETPATTFTSLYKAEPDLFQTLSSLKNMKFIPLYMKPNDESCNEINVFFSRSACEWTLVIEKLSLHKNSVFSGKDFWFNPSHSLSANPSQLRIFELDKRVHAQELEVCRLEERIREQNCEIFRLNSRISDLDAEISTYVKSTDLISEAQND
jgi:FkbM family methyltransferase